ncbi:hypothetical protein [Streptomyces sp. NPDC048845]|uniref:hypothetical protein n=1 Tax=Streptomyces sp. NPDC048845 TaxID=3155390 RepID=UPI00343D9355
MNKRALMRHRTTGALCAVAAAALLMTGCGGGGDSSSDDKIAGAEDAGKNEKDASPSRSKPAEEKDGAPTFDLPSDAEVVIDEDATGDKTKDEVLRDHGYALMAMQESYAHGEPTRNFWRYWMGHASDYGVDGFAEYKKDGRTITGTDRFYDREVQLNGNNATVTYCEDQTKAFDKDIKTGKVHRTDADPSDFRSYKTLLLKIDGHWRVSVIEGAKGDKACQRAA